MASIGKPFALDRVIYFPLAARTAPKSTGEHLIKDYGAEHTLHQEVLPKCITECAVYEAEKLRRKKIEKVTTRGKVGDCKRKTTLRQCTPDVAFLEHLLAFLYRMDEILVDVAVCATYPVTATRRVRSDWRLCEYQSPRRF